MTLSKEQLKTIDDTIENMHSSCPDYEEIRSALEFEAECEVIPYSVISAIQGLSARKMEALTKWLVVVNQL